MPGASPRTRRPGIQVKVGQAEGLLAYELKVPLSPDDAHPYAVGTKPGRPSASAWRCRSSRCRQGRGGGRGCGRWWRRRRRRADGGVRRQAAAWVDGGGMGGHGGGMGGHGGAEAEQVKPLTGWIDREAGSELAYPPRDGRPRSRRSTCLPDIDDQDDRPRTFNTSSMSWRRVGGVDLEADRLVAARDDRERQADGEHAVVEQPADQRPGLLGVAHEQRHDRVRPGNRFVAERLRDRPGTGRCAPSGRPGARVPRRRPRR